MNNALWVLEFVVFERTMGSQWKRLQRHHFFRLPFIFSVAKGPGRWEWEHCNVSDLSDKLKLREAELYANKEQRNRGDSQSQADLDSYGRKKENSTNNTMFHWVLWLRTWACGQRTSHGVWDGIFFSLWTFIANDEVGGNFNPIAKVFIKCIYQGNALSPLLCCIGLKALS